MQYNCMELKTDGEQHDSNFQTVVGRSHRQSNSATTESTYILQDENIEYLLATTTGENG